MKRIISVCLALLLVASLIMSLSACGEKSLNGKYILTEISDASFNKYVGSMTLTISNNVTGVLSYPDDSSVDGAIFTFDSKTMTATWDRSDHVIDYTFDGTSLTLRDDKADQTMVFTKEQSVNLKTE